MTNRHNFNLPPLRWIADKKMDSIKALPTHTPGFDDQDYMEDEGGWVGLEALLYSVRNAECISSWPNRARSPNPWFGNTLRI